MMNDALPPLTPDWNHPQPYDGPSPEETAAFERLRATADGIRVWVTGAYIAGTTPAAWTEFGARLAEVADMCTRLGEDQARTVNPDQQQ